MLALKGLHASDAICWKCRPCRSCGLALLAPLGAASLSRWRQLGLRPLPALPTQLAVTASLANDPSYQCPRLMHRRQAGRAALGRPRRVLRRARELDASYAVR